MNVLQSLVGNRTCAILRAPWWDIVKASTPTILQSKTVTVFNKDGTELIEKRNPMRKYCFKVRASTVVRPMLSKHADMQFLNLRCCNPCVWQKTH
jgi:hypothetical protein